MRERRWLVALLTAMPLSSALADTVAAVETGGSGTLTKCPSLLPTHFCHTYQHVGLPERVAVGDTVWLSFGSNEKEYGFPVARIERDGSHCTIFSEAEPKPGEDKLDVVPCNAAR